MEFMESSARSSLLYYNNQTFCPYNDVDLLFEEEQIAFTYSLETLSHITNVDEMYQQYRPTLINTVEGVIHEEVVSTLLQYCLDGHEKNRFLLRNIDSPMNIDYNLKKRVLEPHDDVIEPRSVISSPPDFISSEKECNIDDRQNSENECFVVESVFSILFLGDFERKDAAKMLERARLRSLAKINLSMQDGSLVDKANAKLVSTNGIEGINIESNHIIKLTYHEDSDGESWEIVAFVSAAVFFLLLLLTWFFHRFLVKQRRKKRGVQMIDDFSIAEIENSKSGEVQKSRNVERSLDEEKSPEVKQQFSLDEQSPPVAMKRSESLASINSDNSAKSANSISSYNGETRHNLDVHRCTSAFCVTCQRAGPQPSFIMVRSKNPDIVMQPKVEDKWWRNLDQHEEKKDCSRSSRQ